jgi:predicted anti-sigma-YlaC factor YlaD
VNVTREVVLDLLPVYLSGEASADTQALVEEFLKQDRDLAATIRAGWMEKMSAAAPSDLPPDLELKAFRRTKRMMGRLRWLLGLAIFFTSIALSVSFETQGWHVTRIRLFLLEQAPVEWALSLTFGAACWAAYFLIRRRLRTAL